MNNSLLVMSAPAGSGKTTRLVREYLRCVSELPVASVVAITFTRKAAAELVDRVSGVLVTLSAGGELQANQRELCEGIALSPSRAAEALALLPAAPVSTVDSFVQGLLQEFLLDAALPLPSGERAPIDGPLELETNVDDVYRVSAREALEELSDDARRLISHVSVRDACADLSQLARHTGLTRLPAHRLSLDFAHALTAETAHALAHVTETHVNGVGKRVHAEVTAWLLERNRPPPEGFLVWLLLMGKRCEAYGLRGDLLKEVLTPHGLGHLSRLCEKLSFDEGWTEPGCLQAADALAQSIIHLASSTRERALRAMAARGRLGYDEMLVAATELCRSCPDALSDRYRALLVDEVQDTNPAQLAFYAAFRGVGERDGRPFRSVFVGDVRQSIYRFRAADPHGWEPLLDEARERGCLEELTVNYRSSQLLVKAQRLMVEALRELEGATEPHEGLRPLDGLSAQPKASHGIIADSRWPAPICLVDGSEGMEAADVHERVLALFAARLEERWRIAPDESAAVLVPSWVMGRRAVERLRQCGLRAQLWGERALLESRVAKDLRLFIQALMDPSDGVSVVGVLKHPSVGLSDAGLLALRRGRGLAAALVEMDGPLVDGFSPKDVKVLARVRPVLNRARQAMGRRPTAEVLETLIEALRWRPLLAAGPEGYEALAPGEGLAQLELLMDLVRTLEEKGTDPCHALEVLTPDPSRQEDLPPVRLHAGERTVEVVTLHGAKGLAWDHVALLGIGHAGGGGLNGPRTFRLARVGSHTYVGVKRDPSGALRPSEDPLCSLLSIHEQNEERAEQLRELYVGFTRARHTVTMGFTAPKDRTPSSVSEVVREALFSRREELGEALAVISAAEINVVTPEPPRRGPTVRVRPFVSERVEANGWQLTQPTALGEELAPDVCREIRQRMRAHATLELGTGAPPFPEHPLLRTVPETVLGELIHGWLEVWAFQGAPDLSRADAFLRERWGLEDSLDSKEVRALLAPWLQQAGCAVRDQLPGFASLLCGKLHFERPLLGRIGANVITGRTDLVIEKPDGGLVVVDFKAGSRVAHSLDDIPGFSGYALQLEAYRRLLAASGRRVDEVGLLYVRHPGPTWVRFSAQSDAVVPAQSPAPSRRQLSLFDEPR